MAEEPVDSEMRSQPPVEVTVIVPTLNEAENLKELVPRIGAALAGRAHEVIVVDDDSRDGTPEACAALAAQGHPLRLIVRAQPCAGLSGAVLEGIRAARGGVLVVMDADLQHPPERIPDLIARLEGGADFALGSRYAPGGSTAEHWGPFRRLNSRIATALARPFAGRTTDPMSGFFAVRRDTLAHARRLTPLGYKIGLELMCKCEVGDVREVPIHFSTRAHGHSKLTLQQQFKYLEHLSRLYDFCYPRASPILKFLIVIACGWFVGLGAYGVMLMFDVAPGVAIPAAYVGSIAVTALFHLRYVRTQREFLATRRPWRDFLISSLAEIAACAAAASWVLRIGPVHAMELFAFCFGAATVVRYVLRKEFLLDVRGLRTDPRARDVGAQS